MYLTRYQSIKLMFVAFMIMVVNIHNSVVEAKAVQGNPLATITITEYVDFQCSYCAQAKKTVDETMKKYKGEVNLVLKHLPLDFHAGALPAARYFEALYQRNPAIAWKFYNIAFNEQSELKKGEIGIQLLIDKLHLTQEELEQLSLDLTDPIIDERINADIAEANAMGIDEVPFFFINGHKIENYDTPEEFNQIINTLLMEKGKVGSVH